MNIFHHYNRSPGSFTTDSSKPMFHCVVHSVWDLVADRCELFYFIFFILFNKLVLVGPIRHYNHLLGEERAGCFAFRC